MGGGRYDYEEHQAATTARAGLGAGEVFTQNACHADLNPLGVHVRESRDSENHPDSLSIVFALDVSGSMGEIPVQLATRTMPGFMKAVTTVVPDPQVLFMAVGCAFCDKSALQVGQFESESSLIDKWLGMLHLEGGGGWRGESYDLAMYFAARHTAIDCHAKRGRRGYLFMTGDEVFFMRLQAHTVKQWIGDDLKEELSIVELTDELVRRYRTFFLIPDQKRADTDGCGYGWRLLLGDCVIVLGHPGDTAAAAALLVGICEGQLRDVESLYAKAEGELGYRDEGEQHRLIAAVRPYLEAILKGGGEPPSGPRPGLTEVPAQRQAG
jgi:hypothetical protein